MPNPVPRLSTLELRILEKSAQTLTFMDGAWELLIALANQFARPEQGQSEVMSSAVLFDALATTEGAREARVRSVIAGSGFY